MARSQHGSHTGIWHDPHRWQDATRRAAPSLSRREWLGFAGVAALVYAAGLRPAAGQQAKRLFLRPAEEQWLAAAVDRILPRDEWPSATEAGVLDYLDFQLATDWGGGQGLYRQGPHRLGTESQGYQLPYTPAELYRNVLASLAKEPEFAGFATASASAQDEALTRLQKGDVMLGDVPGRVFFDILRRDTIEGYLSDPIHHGNRDLIGWRMLGFPGAHAYYLTEVDRFDLDYRREPSGVAARPSAAPTTDRRLHPSRPPGFSQTGRP